MNQSNILIQEQDYYFCKAFQEIINLPSSKLVKKLNNLESLAAAKEYFANLSSESYDKPKEIADHIAAFCRRSENKNLDKLLKEIYSQLNPEGINNLVTIKKNPNDEALADPKIPRKIINEARDICKYIERWAKQKDNNQKQETDDNQSDLNDSNSN